MTTTKNRPDVNWLRGLLDPNKETLFEVRTPSPSEIASLEMADFSGMLCVVGIRHVGPDGKEDAGPAGGPIMFQTFRDAICAWARGKACGPTYGVEFRIVNPTATQIQFVGIAITTATGEAIE